MKILISKGGAKKIKCSNVYMICRAAINFNFSSMTSNKVFFKRTSLTTRNSGPKFCVRTMFRQIFKQTITYERTSYRALHAVQIRPLQTLVRIKGGALSQGHKGADGHFAISDLTPQEIIILNNGGKVYKNDLLISTHAEFTDGLKNITVCMSDLDGNPVPQRAINLLDSAWVKIVKKAKAHVAETALMSAQTQAVNNRNTFGIPKIDPNV